MIGRARLGDFDSLFLSARATEARHVRPLGTVVNRQRAELRYRSTLVGRSCRDFAFVQRCPRCPLHRMPRRPVPRGARRAPGRVLHRCGSSLAAGWFHPPTFRITSLNGTAALCAARVTSSFALSALKSRYHETVKFGQVNWFGEKGERTVGESLFLRLREQAP